MHALLRYVLLIVKDVAYGINAGHAIRHGLKPPAPSHRPVRSHAPQAARHENAARSVKTVAHGVSRQGA